MKTIDIVEHEGLVHLTVTVPRYQKNNPKAKNGTNEKIKLDLPAVRNLIRKMPSHTENTLLILNGRCVEGATLDNRDSSTCSVTWVFQKVAPYEPPAATPPTKPKKTTTRRRRSRKTTKKTETEV
jgi:hypothetical protein